MNMKALGIITLLVVTSIIAGCQKDSTTSPYTPTCDGTAKSYSADVAPLISNYCSGCHSQYSTYAKLSASASQVRSVIVSGSMPKGTTLSSTQKDAIVCWIDNGTLNN
jgi:uncharacterized membrane protein